MSNAVVGNVISAQFLNHLADLSSGSERWSYMFRNRFAKIKADPEGIWKA